MQSERSTDRCDRDVMLSSAAGDRRGRQRVSTITKGMICGPATFKTSQLTKGGLSVPGTNHSSLYLAVVRGRDNFPHHSILLTHLHNTPMLCAWSILRWTLIQEPSFLYFYFFSALLSLNNGRCPRNQGPTVTSSAT